MGTENRSPKPKLLSSNNSTPEPQRAERLCWIIDQLTMVAIAKGQTYTAERLRINAEDLIDIPQDALALAFARARRELDYLPQVSEIRRLALVDEAGRLDGEMRAAWDVLIDFVAKYVGNDVHGVFGPEHGWYPKSYPTMSDRILDTVRRTGGWKAYKCMTQKDLPFVQKRFFEEYTAWTAVERVDASKLIASMPQLRLVPKGVDQPTKVPPETIAPPVFKAKPIPKAMTDAELRDRREMLRQQTEALKARTSVTVMKESVGTDGTK